MFSRAAAIQGVCVAAAALAVAVSVGAGAVVAVLYGGAVALANSGLLLWRHGRGAQDRLGDAGRHLKQFYRSSLERFVVVGVCLAVGFGVLGLAALPMLLGFVVGQLAWIAAAWSFR